MTAFVDDLLMEVSEAHKPEPVSQPIIMVLQREIDEELRHWLLGQTLKRIRHFCAQHDSDADPIVFSREVERDFAKDRDHEFLIIVAVQNMKVVGHLLADNYHYYGRRYVCVSQLELDVRLTLEQQRDAFQAVITWQKELQAHGIRAATANAALIPWFQALGFVRIRTLMEWRKKEPNNGRQ